MNSIYLRVLY